MTFDRKVPVIVKPAYTVSLERTDAMTFVHCVLHERWTPAIRASLRSDWQAFRLLHEAPILALHVPGDRKHLKFLTMFGFTFLGSFTDAESNADMEIFIHTLGN